MNKTFYTDKRPITIRINDDFVNFHFKNENDRHFYTIPKDEWIYDKTNRLDRSDNWHIHMINKTWFTKEMKTFIDINTGDNGKS